MNRGAIHWARGDKRRPVLIVSPTARNESARDVLGVPLSTNRREGSWHVVFRKGEAGLPRPCVAQCERVAIYFKHDIEGPIGEVSPERMREVERALMDALGIEIP